MTKFPLSQYQRIQSPKLLFNLITILRFCQEYMSMVHYLSAFRVRDLSAFAVERLSRFISSIGGDIDGSDKVSAKSQDESVQASLR